MDSTLLDDARLIYDYHRMHEALPAPSPAAAIFCLCSLDLRVARCAARLFLDGLAPWLIFSGGSGKLTANHPAFGHDPEAVVFARIAMAMGVPEAKIIIEPDSTNTGENVRLTYKLLQQKRLLATTDESHGQGSIRSFILVQKPYMERRTYATFVQQWPDSSSQFTVTSPQLDFAEYPDSDNPQDLVVNIMVGDLVRIREYPSKGYQIEQTIPAPVWEAGQRLIAAGYTKHLP
ncbi:DUF218 domain-containing protein [Coniella lustricola]|uniref:DUF218 domain-containing protein n=1 Tax=Coniella lustricola TaxID=2025994 RepID=A0A2T2ZY22_9PEZI|nr:DUF218 domain-containing protein [Coniella lustricola]